MIKVKTFQTNGKNSRLPFPDQIAQLINEWVYGNPSLRIISIQTDLTARGFGVAMMTASVWYEGEAEDLSYTVSSEAVAEAKQIGSVLSENLQLLQNETLVAGIKE